MKFTLKVATAILFLSMLWRVGLADEGVVDLSGQCWELRRLNSEGHYREAEAQARVILTAPVHRLQFYRLNVLLHLYAALGRQGKGGSAQAAYCDFVEEAKLRGKNQPEVVSQMIELRRLDDKEASELSPFALKSTEALECGEQPTSDHVKLDRIIDYCRDTGADSVIIIQNGRPVVSWKSESMILFST